MKFSDLFPEQVESYRLNFLIEKCFDDLFSCYEDLPNFEKSLLLIELSQLVIKFSPAFFGGTK